MPDERNVLDYAYVLLRWRRLIVVSVVVVCAAAAGVSLVLPARWQATTTLLPPDESTGKLGFSMLVSQAVPANLAGLIGTSTPGERLATLVSSRRVLGAVVDRFELTRVYGTPRRQQAIEWLDESTERELGRDGTFTLSVEMGDPRLAADVANGLAAELDAASQEIKRHQAHLQRLFLEDRVAAVRAEIERAALEFQGFQERNGLVDLEAQTEASVDVVRQIVQEAALLEVQLGVIREQFGSDHEKRQLLEIEAVELRRQLRLLTGEPGSGGPDAVEETVLRALGPPLDRIPDLGRQYARLALDMRIREQMAVLLVGQLEEARYRESLDTPTIQVLDAATPPDVRSAPRRTLIVIVAGATSLALSVLVAFLLEGLARLDEPNRRRLEAIRSLFS